VVPFTVAVFQLAHSLATIGIRDYNVKDGRDTGLLDLYDVRSDCPRKHNESKSIARSYIFYVVANLVGLRVTLLPFVTLTM
jgi:hypothetical protein